ncbi:hypothetical protein [Fontivita pretiosa]|uniref:hypothetical protein n=1 Tax=Fontivita pretiosa TaxID=2989684 RepID=UPI003D16A0BE
MIDTFPIAPVAFRWGGQVPTQLGRKYETLLDVQAQVSDALRADAGSTDSVVLARGAEATPLEEIIADIVGSPEIAEKASLDLESESSLLPLFFRSLLTLDGSACPLLRACGYAIESTVRL